jgi:hypothetical protein
MWASQNVHFVKPLLPFYILFEVIWTLIAKERVRFSAVVKQLNAGHDIPFAGKILLTLAGRRRRK